MRLAVRRLVSMVLILLGIILLYSAGWIFLEGVLPQVRTAGWSLSETSMILNRQWRGNELYMLVLLYVGGGAGAVTGGMALWCRRRRARDPSR